MDAVKQAALEAAGAEYAAEHGDDTWCKESIEAAITAYEQALWQPVETMPESGCFLAQTLGGEIERVWAWREITGDRRAVWQVGTSLNTDRSRWIRWRPMPEAWRG